MSSWVNKLAVPPTIPGSINVKSGQIDKLRNIENNNILFRGLISAATTTNIELKGLQTIDGVSLEKGLNVLVKDQISKLENGIYVVSENKWERSKLLIYGNIATSRSFLIKNGTVNGRTFWSCRSPTQNFVGKDPIEFFKVIDDGGGGGGPTNSVILKKPDENSIQWKFEINLNNNLEFFYSNDNGETFTQKYIFSNN